MKNELKKVVWLRQSPEHNVVKGKITEIESGNAEKLANEKFVRILPEDYDPNTNKLPEDFPERGIFWQKGYTKVEEIETLDSAELFELGIKADVQLELQVYLKDKDKSDSYYKSDSY